MTGRYIGKFFATLSVWLCLTTVASANSSGTLVIAGGGLSTDNETVWTAFIDSARDEGAFVIIPSASGEPAASARSVTETLKAYGVAEDRIFTAPLAVRDDPSTPDVDESLWSENADSPDISELLSGAAAIWFTGGDQARTADLLIPDGRVTPALTALHAAHSKGASVGGTSAGAAIMSDPMILRGDSLGALSGQGEPLRMGPGLGFLRTGLVDQHFGERARLGRLAMALESLAQADRIGFGIDEDTALIVSNDGIATIAGSGYLTVLDGRDANWAEVQPGRFAISGLRVHIAGAGDELNLSTGQITPASWKKPTVGQEYRETALTSGSGITAPPTGLATLLGEGLVDNSAAQELERIGFAENGQGVAYSFTQTDAAYGYWGRDVTGRAGYTIGGVDFDIRPIDLNILELK